MEAKKCMVCIAGTMYTLRTDQPESDIVKAAELVDSFVHNIVSKSSAVLDKDKAILIALQIAVEYMQLKHTMERCEQQILPLIVQVENELL